MRKLRERLYKIIISSKRRSLRNIPGSFVHDGVKAECKLTRNPSCRPYTARTIFINKDSEKKILEKLNDSEKRKVVG